MILNNIQKLQESTPSLFISGESLTLSSIGKDYGGEYICVADNGIGIPAQSTIMLNVLCKYYIFLHEY